MPQGRQVTEPIETDFRPKNKLAMKKHCERKGENDETKRKGELKMITKSFERKLENLGAFEIFERRMRKS